MNEKIVKSRIELNQIYKYVAILVPPMLALVNINRGINHADIALKYDLVSGSGSLSNPYKPRQPGNFRAGRMKIDEKGVIVQTGKSTDFDKFSFADSNQLTEFFEIANIVIL